MKFLKRLGKKIKKGVKKLMGSKIGRIVGMIGLSMAMGAATKALIGNFGTTATTAVGETVGATVGETVGATSTPLLEEITVSATKRPVLESITTASTSSEAMTGAMDHMMSETVASNGMVNPDVLSSVHNNITDSVMELNETVFNPEYQNSLASENLFSQDLPSLSESLESGTLSANAAGTTSITGGGGPQTTSLLEPIEVTGKFRGTEWQKPAGMTDKKFKAFRKTDPAWKEHLAAGKEANFLSSASLGEKIKYRAGQFGTEFKEGLDTPGEFAGGILQGTASAAAMSAIMGEEEVYGRGQVMPQADMVGPKAAYIQDITPSFREATNTNIMPTFTQLQKAPIYGQGTPQWLQMFEDQNLLMPSMLGIQLPYRSV